MPSADSSNLKVSRLIDRRFVEEADRVLIALKNLVDRNFPRKLLLIPGYRPFLQVAIYATKNTFDAIRYVVADSPIDPHRNIAFGLAISPMIRFFIDLLFTVIIIRQSPRVRVMWYHRAGWRELKEALDRLKSEPGASRRFARQIQKQEAALEYIRKVYKISRRTESDLRSIRRWPIPGQFLNPKRVKISIRPRKFLAFLHLWFYSELSQEAHISGGGVVRIYSKLLLEKEDSDRERILKVIKSNNFMMSLTLVIAIATEINDICRFDRNERLAYLWRVITEESHDAKRLFNLRYKAMLSR